MEETEKVIGESEVPLKCLICLSNFQNQLELERHNIIDYKNNHPPLSLALAPFT